MRRRALGNIQELYNSCTISLIGKLLLLQLINLGLWETVHPPPTPRGNKSPWVTVIIVVREKKSQLYSFNKKLTSIKRTFYRLELKETNLLRVSTQMAMNALVSVSVPIKQNGG